MLSFMKSLFEIWLWSFQFSELCFLQALLHPLLGGGINGNQCSMFFATPMKRIIGKLSGGGRYQKLVDKVCTKKQEKFPAIGH